MKKMKNHMEWVAKPDKRYRYLAYNLAHLETSLHMRVGEFPLEDGFYIRSFHDTRRFEYPWVIEHLPRKRRKLLDAGGGWSPLQFFFAMDEGTEVYNVDNDRESVKKVNRQIDVLRSQGLYGNIHIQIGDIGSLPFPDDFFDSSYSVSVLEHTEQSTIIDKIKELQRVTKDVILLTVDVTFKRGVNPAVFTKDMLKEIAEEYGFFVPKLSDGIFIAVLPEPFDALPKDQVLHTLGVACIYLNAK